AIRLLFEPHNFEHLRHYLGDATCRRSGHFKRKRNILKNSFLKQQFKILEDNANLTPEVRHNSARDISNVPVANKDFPTRRPLFGNQKLYECCLPGATL